MENQHPAQSTSPRKLSPDRREMTLGRIQAALLDAKATLTQTGGFDPYNCRQGSDRDDVWAPRRR